MLEPENIAGRTGRKEKEGRARVGNAGSGSKDGGVCSPVCDRLVNSNELIRR